MDVATVPWNSWRGSDLSEANLARANLSRVDLSEADPGEYDMACLPLRIVGADGSPARVVLRKRT